MQANVDNNAGHRLHFAKPKIL